MCVYLYVHDKYTQYTHKQKPLFKHLVDLITQLKKNILNILNTCESTNRNHYLIFINTYNYMYLFIIFIYTTVKVF